MISTVHVTANDGFGGNATTTLSLHVDYTDYDKFLQAVKILLSVFGPLGTAYAIYKNRGFIFNLLAFWSRPRETVWNIGKESSHKILDRDIPGWFGKEEFLTKTVKVVKKNA